LFTPVIMLVLMAVAAFLIWRYFPTHRGVTRDKLDLSRRPWPVDPRAVADRESLVRAFEYLSIVLCGDAARVWNHRTIAVALDSRVAGAENVSHELASLYELARYTPANEPLSPEALASARRSLCQLAGIPSA
jgi:hypothetical protein